MTNLLAILIYDEEEVNLFSQGALLISNSMYLKQSILECYTTPQ